MQKVRTLVTALLLLVAVQGVFAVRAKTGRSLMTLTDGTQQSVLQCGDEWFHYYLTADGTPMVCQADGRLSAVSWDELRSQETASAERRAAENQRRLQQARAYHGDYRLICILVDFNDRSFSMPQPQLYYDSLLNQRHCQIEGAMGSVHDYFYDQSEGQFSIKFDVVGPIHISQSCKDFSNSYKVQSTLMPDAIHQADELVDFRTYDWNTDGVVEQVFVLYAGYGANETSDSTKNTIWPHESKLSSRVTVDSVRCSVYACSNELWADGTLTGIGTMCHELSHCFGLPDLYDVNASESATKTGGISDAWELMDGGNYNADGWIPAGFSGYEKMACGWLKPVPLTEPTQVSAQLPLQEGGDVYAIYNDGHPDEYYLLENRQKIGWDKALPGHGLLITHVDYDRNKFESNQVNADTTHFRLVPIPADNNLMSYYYKNRPLRHAAYPYVDQDGTVLNDSLTNFSVPAASLYHPNVDGSRLMNKCVVNIRESAEGNVSFYFSNTPTTAILHPSPSTHHLSPTYTWGDLRFRRQPDGTYRKYFYREKQ